MSEEKNIDDKNINARKNAMVFDRETFAKLILNDLTKNNGQRNFLKKYKQSEVREFIENYKTPKNQEKLVEISQLLYAKSPQYQRLLRYFAGMALFSHIITPIKDLKKISRNKVFKQYVEIGELLKLMNIKHEMTKVLNTAFVEDVFYGYVHKTNKDFYIQKLDFKNCRISSVEDGVYNFSVDMTYYQKNEAYIQEWAKEIQEKYLAWKAMKSKNPKLSEWVELDSKNTICIKINEEILETFPLFAGSFDAIFDIENFKQLRLDKEEIGNYMLVTQELPMRKDSEDNNDFMIDRDNFTYFHNMVAEGLPENVGLATTPMKLDVITFGKDRIDNDGVAKSIRDFWSGNGTSQVLFSTENNTSQGILLSVKTDEEIVFGVLNQINRWINRYLKYQFKELMFNVKILDVTYFNKKEVFESYLQAGQYGVPVKSHLSSIVGLEPIEVLNMAYLENDILQLHEEFIPLQSSHTMTTDENNSSEGRPTKDADELGDEGLKSRDK